MQPASGLTDWLAGWIDSWLDGWLVGWLVSWKVGGWCLVVADGSRSSLAFFFWLPGYTDSDGKGHAWTGDSIKIQTHIYTHTKMYVFHMWNYIYISLNMHESTDIHIHIYVCICMHLNMSVASGTSCRRYAELMSCIVTVVAGHSSTWEI